MPPFVGGIFLVVILAKARSALLMMRIRDRARLRRASDDLPVAGSLLFAWPKRSDQEKGHPDGAPFGCAGGLRRFDGRASMP
jgi:hypothetical protein